MQTPDGYLKTLITKEDATSELQRRQMERASKNLTKRTEKPHPIFTVGEEVILRGGHFRIHAIRRNRLILKPIKY